MNEARSSFRGWLSSAAVVVLTAALIALLVYGVTTRAPDASIDQSLADAKSAPAAPLELPLLAAGDRSDQRAVQVSRAAADGAVRLDELTGPLVLNFWASWCQPCAVEAPVLERGWKLNKGVQFLGVNHQDLSDDARDFLERHRLTFPSVRDKTNGTGRSWGITGLPETFFLDADGRVVGHVIGAVDDERLEAGISAAREGRILSGVRGGARRALR